MSEVSNAGAARIGKLLPFRTMYLGYYLAIGVYIPFINLYYERMELTDALCAWGRWWGE